MNPTETPNNNGSAKRTGKNITWTIGMDRVLTDVLFEQFQRGNKTALGWRPVAFRSAILAIKQKFGVSVTKDNIRARLKSWTKHYKVVTELLKQSGFRWDDARKMIAVDNDVWENYVESHPTAKPYRWKVILNYKELTTIIGNKDANGEVVVLGKKLDQEMETMEGHNEDPIREDDEDIAKKGEVNGNELALVVCNKHTNGGRAELGNSVDQEMEANGNTQSKVHVVDNGGLEDSADRGEIDGNEATAANKVGPQQGRARSCASSDVKRPPLKRKRNRDALASAVITMVDLLKSMADAYAHRNIPTADVGKLCEELKKIPDLEQCLILRAIDMLVADKTKEHVFYGLPEELKKPWLLMHLGQSKE